jgi:hypothetical protein
MNKPKMIGSSIVGWDNNEENKRIVFLEHMYRCDGREEPSHPKHGTYTGLWQNFCLNEAGEAMRDQWFERMEAADEFIRNQQLAESLQLMPFIPTLDD